MTRVADKNGHPIEGLTRATSYGLVVENPSAYSKYLMDKQRAEDVERLKQDMSEVKGMLSKILKAINGESNV